MLRITLLAILFFVSFNSHSQTTDENMTIEELLQKKSNEYSQQGKKLIKDGISLEKSPTNKMEINPYFKGDMLYIVYEMDVNLNTSEMDKMQIFMRDKSKQMVYDDVKRNFTVPSVVNLLLKVTETNYIKYEMNFTSSDYKTYSTNYVIKVSELQAILDYFNKSDLFKIMKSNY